VTFTDEGSGGEEPLNFDKSAQCVTGVTSNGTKTTETCTQAAVMTCEAATQTDGR